MISMKLCFVAALLLAALDPALSLKSAISRRWTRSYSRRGLGDILSRDSKLLASSDVEPSQIESTTQTQEVARPATAEFALLFDCDGVIVETEELHRVAYNKAFESFQLQLPDGRPVVWDVAYYDILQNTVGGGKPKMKHYFNNEVKAWPTAQNPVMPAPSTLEEQTKLVDLLQDAKTEFYKEIVEEIAVARPGVLELMDEALADPTLKVGICSAATKAGFEKIVNAVVKPDRLSKLDIIIAGDDVTEKKPNPMIYNIASERIGIPPERCVVIEDSLVGLRAAKGANMNCVITYTESTAREDFYGEGAQAKLINLQGVTVQDIFKPLIDAKDSDEASAGGSAVAGAVGILAEKRDPMPSAAASKTLAAAAAAAPKKSSTPARKAKKSPFAAATAVDALVKKGKSAKGKRNTGDNSSNSNSKNNTSGGNKPKVTTEILSASETAPPPSPSPKVVREVTPVQETLTVPAYEGWTPSHTTKTD